LQLINVFRQDYTKALIYLYLFLTSAKQAISTFLPKDWLIKISKSNTTFLCLRVEDCGNVKKIIEG